MSLLWTMTPEFDLFTSLRYDIRLLSSPWNTWDERPASPFFHLLYHYDRLLDAAQQFEWPAAIGTLTTPTDPAEFLQSICQKCVDRSEDPRQPLRIRLLLSRNGDLRAESFSTPPLEHDLLGLATSTHSFNVSTFPGTQLKVYIDTEPTPRSVHTSYKTTARVHYDAARTRMRITRGNSTEVLLYNSDNEVMEGSVRNVAFWREGRWVTPDLASGCLSGTVRRWLLEKEQIFEGRINLQDVKEDEWILLFNGVEGVLPGRVYKV